MTRRPRHAILVQLVDGPVGAEQEAAIRSLGEPGSSLSSALRAILLREAGRVDLDVPHTCAVFAADVTRPSVCATCTRPERDHSRRAPSGS